ncbi:hypothetical protein GMJAKD_07865 [Candidatus Electrothrix aarhusensis]|jgi:hypothetical protein
MYTAAGRLLPGLINLPDAGKKDKRNLIRWMLRLKK